MHFYAFFKGTFPYQSPFRSIHFLRSAALLVQVLIEHFPSSPFYRIQAIFPSLTFCLVALPSWALAWRPWCPCFGSSHPAAFVPSAFQFYQILRCSTITRICPSDLGVQGWNPSSYNIIILNQGVFTWVITLGCGGRLSTSQTHFVELTTSNSLRPLRFSIFH